MVSSVIEIPDTEGDAHSNVTVPPFVELLRNFVVVLDSGAIVFIAAVPLPINI